MKPSHVPTDGSEQALCAAAAPSQLPNTVDTRTVELVEQIQRGDPAAITKLYQTLSTGLRFLICRQLGAQDADDRVHDTFLVVIEAIQRGKIRDPACLMGFVRTVGQRQVVTHIRGLAIRRSREVDVECAVGAIHRSDTPEQNAIRDENVAIMRKVLQSLSPRDREVLTRFYLDEQPAERIISEMGLTPTQFRVVRRQLLFPVNDNYSSLPA